MGDRVAAITGGTERWDHFQFPVGRTYDEWQAFSRPEEHALNLPLTLEQAMELHWRVKQWKVTISGNVVTSISPLVRSSLSRFAIFKSGEASITDDDTGDEEVVREANQREAQLVAGVYDEGDGEYDLPERWHIVDSHNEQGGSGEGAGMTISLDSAFAAAFYLNFNDPENPVFYPVLRIFTPYVRSLRNTFSLPSQGSFTLEMATGTVVDTLGSWPTGTSGAGPYNELDIKMKATEWWPYATTDDLPVYDTSTGAQLRDPFE